MRHKMNLARYAISMCVFVGVLWGNIVVDAQQPLQGQPARGVASLAIVDVEGDAQVLTRIEAEKRRGMAQILTEAWEPAKPRTMLSSGDQLKTGARSSMKLQMADGTVVMIAGDSVVTVEEMRSARGESPQTTQLKLVQGKISTEQTTRILGQTNQIISTDNGSVNTRLGEVEVRKPAPVPQEYAMIASLSPHLMYIAKQPEKDDTYVTLNRGTATVESFGKGRIITNSQLLPETCVGEDGIKFTLEDPKAQVTVSRLEDQNGFRLTAREYFHLLVATEGNVNQVNIVTESSDAMVDIEGVEVAEQDADARSILKLHPLLTVGVKSADVIVNLICDTTESRGLNEFGIQRVSGGVRELRPEAFGPGTGRPDPSRGLVSRTPTPSPGTPTPTPTPTPEGEWVTPTPTPTPLEGEEEEEMEEEFVPPPRAPVTDIRPAAPTITDIGLTCSHHGCNALQDRIEVRFHYNDLTPMVLGGYVHRLHPNAPPTVAHYFTQEIDASPHVSHESYSYTYTGGESADVLYWFCFDQTGTLDPYRDFELWITDEDGNPSNRLTYTVPDAASCP